MSLLLGLCMYYIAMLTLWVSWQGALKSQHIDLNRASYFRIIHVSTIIASIQFTSGFDTPFKQPKWQALLKGVMRPTHRLSGCDVKAWPGVPWVTAAAFLVSSGSVSGSDRRELQFRT